ncbi:microcystin-dependent protein, partial [Xanthomonas perforans]
QQGPGPGLTPHTLGSNFGSAGVNLSDSEMPMHQHGVNSFSLADQTKKSGAPVGGAALSSPGSSSARPYNAIVPDKQFSPVMLIPTGNGQAHENRQPYLAVNFCIALSGDYPVFS